MENETLRLYAMVGVAFLFLLPGVGLGVWIGRRIERAKALAWGRGLIDSGNQVIDRLMREAGPKL